MQMRRQRSFCDHKWKRNVVCFHSAKNLKKESDTVHYRYYLLLLDILFNHWLFLTWTFSLFTVPDTSFQFPQFLIIIIGIGPEKNHMSGPANLIYFLLYYSLWTAWVLSGGQVPRGPCEKQFSCHIFSSRLRLWVWLGQDSRIFWSHFSV